LAVKASIVKHSLPDVFAPKKVVSFNIMKSLFLINFFLISFYISLSQAAYFDTLPKGVRNITYRLVQTGEISGSYNSSGNFKGYNLNANINAEVIRGLNGAVDAYLNTLTDNQLANFSFGTFEGNASSKLTAQGFGGGYGVSDKFTVYGFIPFYSAQVDLNIKRTAKGRDTSGTLISIDNLPDVDARLIQSLIVNYYGYKPLGQWKATDFGDAEIGFLYQVKKWREAGLLCSMGLVAPTGRKDNPDILQDIAFGDGQWDLFLEFGGGANIYKNWSLDAWSRMTYQAAYNANIRLPDSQIFPVTTRAGEAKIKLGNKAQGNLQFSYRFSDQCHTSSVYTLEYKERDSYQSAFSNANNILAIDTEKISHTVKLNLNYSTISLYKRKKFLAPLNFNLAISSVVKGKNVPQYERADFEMSLFF
jgi:hypothetical protein